MQVNSYHTLLYGEPGNIQSSQYNHHLILKICQPSKLEISIGQDTLTEILLAYQVCKQ